MLDIHAVRTSYITACRLIIYRQVYSLSVCSIRTDLIPTGIEYHALNKHFYRELIFTEPSEIQHVSMKAVGTHIISRNIIHLLSGIVVPNNLLEYPCTRGSPSTYLLQSQNSVLPPLAQSQTPINDPEPPCMFFVLVIVVVIIGSLSSHQYPASDTAVSFKKIRYLLFASHVFSSGGTRLLSMEKLIAGTPIGSAQNEFLHAQPYRSTISVIEYIVTWTSNVGDLPTNGIVIMTSTSRKIRMGS
ncbi:hypothetical protein AG1IA_09710 [Rhizoctonia solani AG-1 IA]|uniref:Uncharacterized protein n=1 Tax=Thanatephorus cucumeris (strain AG1-IA) TaxID=983506 RepID=L8WEA1_THACA|nr:hypothetical protein AG1IA_09710 [Rhizoctonia solani AG-1 IA]